MHGTQNVAHTLITSVLPFASATSAFTLSAVPGVTEGAVLAGAAASTGCETGAGAAAAGSAVGAGAGCDPHPAAITRDKKEKAAVRRRNRPPAHAPTTVKKDRID